ncbi:glyoxylate/hydroxypyruvate reductase HPR3-like [Elaeis guineensis]|uniref:glyoxylate/hydroxypyruvate reductase HPR3-like n=1 Tax=Elaeis guineensis var. tenera TaxID=51953 RepID=UPI003C6DB570
MHAVGIRSSLPVPKLVPPVPPTVRSPCSKLVNFGRDSPPRQRSCLSETPRRRRRPLEREQLPPVLLSRPLSSPFHDALASKFHFLKPWESPLPRDEFLAAHAGDVRALLCFGPNPAVDAELLACLPKLELVVAFSTGVNHIDLAECRRRGIAVTNAGNAFTEDVADYAVALLIDVLRQISAADRYVRRGLWPINGDCPLGHKVTSCLLPVVSVKLA